MKLFFWRHDTCELDAAIKAHEDAKTSLARAQQSNEEVTELNKKLYHLRKSNGFAEVIVELFERRDDGRGL